jgi:urease accessory protein
MCARHVFALFVVGLLFLMAMAQPALAHPGHAGHELADGWWHPLAGADHLLAMVAVGLLGVRLGGRGLWLMPAAFLGSMLAGGLLASAGVPFPGVEWGIMASVLVLGLLVAATSAVPLWIGALLVGLFAACHGNAHAAEMVAGGSFGSYAAGFLLATATLHAAGIVVGMLLARQIDIRALRWSGAAIAAASLLIVLGLV